MNSVATLLCVGRRVDPLLETAESIGNEARTLSADISTDEGVEAVREAVDGDAVRCVVHAAAVEGIATVGDSSYTAR